MHCRVPGFYTSDANCENKKMSPDIANCPFGATCSHSPVYSHYFVFLATLEQLYIIRQLRLLIADISTPEMLLCSIYWLFLLLDVFTNG